MQIQSISELTSRKCNSCEGGVEPCTPEHAKRQTEALNGWSLSDDGRMISRKWKLKNFVKAMELLNEAAVIAEAEQHHPDLHLTSYRNVQIDLTTHAISGLSENDFIVAAKIDVAAEKLS